MLVILIVMIQIVYIHHYFPLFKIQTIIWTTQNEVAIHYHKKMNVMIGKNVIQKDYAQLNFKNVKTIVQIMVYVISIM